MIDLMDTDAAHVVGFRVDGKVREEDVDRVTKALEGALTANDRISMLVELADFDGFTADGLVEDLRFSLRRLADLHRFYRVAVVTDEQWIRTVAGWENRLIPGIDVKAYAASDKVHAVAWVNAPIPVPEDGIAEVEVPGERYVAFEVTGKLHGRDLRRVAAKLESEYKKHGKLRVFLKVDRIPRVTLGGLVEDVKLLKTLSWIERYAVVGPDWLKVQIKAFRPLLKFDVEHFDLDEEDEAWAWLKADQKRAERQ